MTLVITALACLVGIMILGLYASVAASVHHFRREDGGPGEPLLPMTLIKPVRGLDDGMRENFEAIADSDPGKSLQVIIALESGEDAAAAVARSFAAAHGDRDILVSSRILQENDVSGEETALQVEYTAQSVA